MQISGIFVYKWLHKYAWKVCVESGTILLVEPYLILPLPNSAFPYEFSYNCNFFSIKICVVEFVLKLRLHLKPASPVVFCGWNAKGLHSRNVWNYHEFINASFELYLRELLWTNLQTEYSISILFLFLWIPVFLLLQHWFLFFDVNIYLNSPDNLEIKWRWG